VGARPALRGRLPLPRAGRAPALPSRPAPTRRFMRWLLGCRGREGPARCDSRPLRTMRRAVGIRKVDDLPGVERAVELEHSPSSVSSPSAAAPGRGSPSCRLPPAPPDRKLQAFPPGRARPPCSPSSHLFSSLAGPLRPLEEAAMPPQIHAISRETRHLLGDKPSPPSCAISVQTAHLGIAEPSPQRHAISTEARQLQIAALSVHRQAISQ